MRNIRQIRENGKINEAEGNEARKLATLIRAGLFDTKKLPMLKRALEKDPSKLTPQERTALIELLDHLMDQVLQHQQVFTKVKQNVSRKELNEDEEFSMARSELKSLISDANHIISLLKGEGNLEAWMQSKITKAADYISSVHDNLSSGESEAKGLDEASIMDYMPKSDPTSKRRDEDIDKQVPPIVTMKRKAIRNFMAGQRVALYYAPLLDQYITIPFSVGDTKSSGPATVKEETINEVSDELMRKAIQGRIDQARAAASAGNVSDKNKYTQKVRKNLKTAKAIKDSPGYNLDKLRDAQKVRVAYAGKNEDDLSPEEAAHKARANAVYKQQLGRFTKKRGDVEAAALGGKQSQEVKQVKAAADKTAKKKEFYKNYYTGPTSGGWEGVGELLGRAAIGAVHAPIALASAGAKKLSGKPKLPSLKEGAGDRFKRKLREQQNQDDTSIRSGLRRFFNIPDDPEHDNKGVNRKFNRYINAGAAAIDDPVIGTVIGGAGGGLVAKKVITSLAKRMAARRAGAAGAKKGVGAAAAGAALGGALGSSDKSRSPMPDTDVIQTSKLAGGEVKGVRGQKDLSPAQIARLNQPFMSQKVNENITATTGTIPLDVPVEDKIKFLKAQIQSKANFSKLAGANTSRPTTMTTQGNPSSLSPVLYRKMTAASYGTRINEDVLSVMKNMVENNISGDTVYINEESISINNNIAEKVLQVHKSLNKNNRTRYEKMLNENAESFKKAINFALRY